MTSEGEPGGDQPAPTGAARWRRLLPVIFVVLSVGLLIPDAVQVLTGRETDPGQIAMLVFAAVVLLVIGISLAVVAVKRAERPAPCRGSRCAASVMPLRRPTQVAQDLRPHDGR